MLHTQQAPWFLLVGGNRWVSQLLPDSGFQECGVSWSFFRKEAGTGHTRFPTPPLCPRPQVGTLLSPSTAGKQGPELSPACPVLPLVEACRLGRRPGATGWAWFAQELPPLRVTS